jgi:hypothetical protein
VETMGLYAMLKNTKYLPKTGFVTIGFVEIPRLDFSAL